MSFNEPIVEDVTLIWFRNMGYGAEEVGADA